MPVNFTRAEGTFKPLGDGVLVKDMEFGITKTSGGIIIPSDDGEARGIHPRWAQVVEIGKKQEDVKQGQWVLVSHGRWSRGFELNGETVRTVDPDDILGISDEEPSKEFMTPGFGHQENV